VCAGGRDRFRTQRLLPCEGSAAPTRTSATPRVALHQSRSTILLARGRMGLRRAWRGRGSGSFLARLNWSGALEPRACGLLDSSGHPAATRTARRQRRCRKAPLRRRMPGTATHRPGQPGRARRRAPSDTTTNDAVRRPSSQARHVSTVRPMASASRLIAGARAGGRPGPACCGD
jgi:hypothetical protein